MFVPLVPASLSPPSAVLTSPARLLSAIIAAHFPLPGEPGYKPPAAAAAAAAAADVKATTAAVKKDKGGQAKAAPAAGSGKSADQADGSKKNKKPWVKGDGADAKSPPGAGGPEVVDASLLDLRVGNIVTAEPHPESDKLFIEKSELLAVWHHSFPFVVAFCFS